jgi:uncharacterized protein YcfJ
MLMRKITTLTLAIAASTLVGCSSMSSQGNGAMIGGGIGALAGQALGGDTEGTLIGAGVGTLLGAIVGNEADHQAEMNRRNREQYHRRDGLTHRQSQTTTVRNADGTYTTTGTETTTSEQEQDGYTGLPRTAGGRP